MFCTKCGTQNPDDASSCATCGTPEGGNSAANRKSATAKRKKRISGEYFLIGGGALALVIALIVIFGGGSGNKTEPIENFWNGMVKADVDKVSSVFPKELREEAFDRMDEDELEESLEDWVGVMEYRVGENLKVTIDVRDEEEFGKDDLEDFREEMEDEYDLNGKKITEAWTIEAKITIKGSEDKDSSVGEFVVYKYKGTWYLDIKNSDVG